MSDEPSNPNLRPWIDPEIEARIVALVLGEASDFEREELERMIAEDRDLAEYCRRIEAVHGLIEGVADPSGQTAAEPQLELPTAMREELLAAFEAAPGTATVDSQQAGDAEQEKVAAVALAEPPEEKTSAASLFRFPRRLRNALAIAALVAGMAVVGVIMSPTERYDRITFKEDAVPITGDLPMVGRLFRSDSDVETTSVSDFESNYDHPATTSLAPTVAPTAPSAADANRRAREALSSLSSDATVSYALAESPGEQLGEHVWASQPGAIRNYSGSDGKDFDGSALYRETVEAEPSPDNDSSGRFNFTLGYRFDGEGEQTGDDSLATAEDTKSGRTRLMNENYFDGVDMVAADAAPKDAIPHKKFGIGEGETTWFDRNGQMGASPGVGGDNEVEATKGELVFSNRDSVFIERAGAGVTPTSEATPTLTKNGESYARNTPASGAIDVTVGGKADMETGARAFAQTGHGGVTVDAYGITLESEPAAVEFDGFINYGSDISPAFGKVDLVGGTVRSVAIGHGGNLGVADAAQGDITVAAGADLKIKAGDGWNGHTAIGHHAQVYGDFDNGMGGTIDGANISKVDEGNTHSLRKRTVVAGSAQQEHPIFQREFLGGANDLRGFRYRDVGPKSVEDLQSVEKNKPPQPGTEVIVEANGLIDDRNRLVRSTLDIDNADFMSGGDDKFFGRPVSGVTIGSEPLGRDNGRESLSLAQKLSGPVDELKRGRSEAEESLNESLMKLKAVADSDNAADQSLPKGWKLQQKESAQGSDGKLLASEQLGAGGHDTVRGFQEQHEARHKSLADNVAARDTYFLNTFVDNQGTLGADDDAVAFGVGGPISVSQAGEAKISIAPSRMAGLSNNLPEIGAGSAANPADIDKELKVHGNVYSPAINNAGMIRSSGATETKARALLTEGSVTNTGEIRATDATASRGFIVVDAGGTGGAVNIGGTVDATGNGDMSGGTVVLLGEEIGLGGTADVRADGTVGGAVIIGSADETTSIRAAAGSRITANGNTSDESDETNESEIHNFTGYRKASERGLHMGHGQVTPIVVEHEELKEKEIQLLKKELGDIQKQNQEVVEKLSGLKDVQRLKQEMVERASEIQQEEVAIASLRGQVAAAESQLAAVKLRKPQLQTVGSGALVVDGFQDSAISLNGTIDAKGGTSGGMITATGGDVTVGATGVLDASGSVDGGFVGIDAKGRGNNLPESGAGSAVSPADINVDLTGSLVMQTDNDDAEVQIGHGGFAGHGNDTRSWDKSRNDAEQGDGGNITVAAKEAVTIDSSGTVALNGATNGGIIVIDGGSGGGTVSVGGEFQGRNTEVTLSTEKNRKEQEAVPATHAPEKSFAEQIPNPRGMILDRVVAEPVPSDDVAPLFATLPEALGRGEVGNGGLVEVSGKRNITLRDGDGDDDGANLMEGLDSGVATQSGKKTVESQELAKDLSRGSWNYQPVQRERQPSKWGAEPEVVSENQEQRDNSKLEADEMAKIFKLVPRIVGGGSAEGTTRLARVDIDGNHKSGDDVIRREVLNKPGELSDTVAKNGQSNALQWDTKTDFGLYAAGNITTTTDVRNTGSGDLNIIAGWEGAEGEISQVQLGGTVEAGSRYGDTVVGGGTNLTMRGGNPADDTSMLVFEAQNPPATEAIRSIKVTEPPSREVHFGTATSKIENLTDFVEVRSENLITADDVSATSARKPSNRFAHAAPKASEKMQPLAEGVPKEIFITSKFIEFPDEGIEGFDWLMKQSDTGVAGEAADKTRELARESNRRFDVSVTEQQGWTNYSAATDQAAKPQAVTPGGLTSANDDEEFSKAHALSNAAQNAPSRALTFMSGGTTGSDVAPVAIPHVFVPLGSNPITARNRSGGFAVSDDSIDGLIASSAGTDASTRSDALDVFGVAGVFTDPQYQQVLRALPQIDQSARFEPTPSQNLWMEVDDETSKSNVNTHAGGTAWDTPRAGGDIDRNLGRFNPVGENHAAPEIPSLARADSSDPEIPSPASADPPDTPDTSSQLFGNFVGDVEVISRFGSASTLGGQNVTQKFFYPTEYDTPAIPSNFGFVPDVGGKPVDALETSLSLATVRTSSPFSTSIVTDPYGTEYLVDALPPAMQLDVFRIAYKSDEKSPVPEGLDETTTSDEPFSTFSLHVSDVSFTLAETALDKGEWPDAERIRVEEFVNAFDYGDPLPSLAEKVNCQMEQTIHPFLQQRNLLRLSMRTAAAGRSQATPLHLTLVLDHSGSMERHDRQQTVQRAFARLADQLTENDTVTVIGFARQPRLLVDRATGNARDRILAAAAETPTEGGTHLESALDLAFEKAREQAAENAQNRVILLTDGAANLGDADPERLAEKIHAMREAGIAFDAAGIGADGLNDEILEALTRKGDGRYYLLNQPEDADEGFARQIAGALRPAAMNVKVQIEFNPERVASYKLLGFEKHRLKKEDFRNDKVDAAEIAAEEAGVAVYQFEPLADGKGDVGTAFLRFRDMSTGQMVEKRWPIAYAPDAPRPEQASPKIRLATAAALFAAKLKGDALGASVELADLTQLLNSLPPQLRELERVQRLHTMIEQARNLQSQ